MVRRNNQQPHLASHTMHAPEGAGARASHGSTLVGLLGCSNFSHSAIAVLVEERGWRRLSPYDAIGAIPAIAYRLAPRSIVHSWVEVLHDGRWINLVGFILDAGYLDGVRCLFPEARGDFCGYAIGTPKIEAPPVEWTGGDTYMQKTGIDHNFCVFDSPDAFYEKHGANLSGLRRLLFVWMVRHMMKPTIGRIGTPPRLARSLP